MYNENADQRHKIRTILYIAAALLAFGKTKPLWARITAHTDFFFLPRAGHEHLTSRDFSGIITVQGKYPEKREYGGTGRRTRFRFWRRDPCRFDSCYSHHNRTPILIQFVSRLVSFFFLRKPLFTRFFQHNLTKADSAASLKRLPESLFHFIPLYYLTKGRGGVHFRQRGVHILIIPQKRKKESPQNRQL